MGHIVFGDSQARTTSLLHELKSPGNSLLRVIRSSQWHCTATEVLAALLSLGRID